MINQFIRLLCVMVLIFLAGSMPACSRGGDDDDSGEAITDDETDDTSADDDIGHPFGYVETCEDGPPLAYDIDSIPMVVPYPNDLYTVQDSSSLTGRRLQIDGNTALPMGRLAGMKLFGFMVNAINTLDGFSTLADFYMPVGEKPLEASFPDPFVPGFGQSLFVMVDDPDSAFNGEFTPVAARLLNGIIHIRPAFALRENTSYVLVATRHLKPETGNCYKASSSMRKVWNAYANEVKDTRIDELVNSLANLMQLGFDLNAILSISRFSTVAATRGLNDARKALDQLAVDSPPALTDWQFYNLTIPSQMPHVDRYAYAHLNMPMFKSENGHWDRDAQGNLAVQSWEDVEVLLTLPKADLPAAGQPYPLVVYGHGLGDVKESLSEIHLGDIYAENGFALVGIDNICHGSRAPFPTSSPYIQAVESLICYFNFLDPLAMRDRFRESTANQIWLTRALQKLGEVDNIPEGGDGIPDYDVNHIYFTGISMGAIEGGTFSALEKNIDGWVLSSDGAKWMGIALEGPYFGAFLDIAQQLDQIGPNWQVEELLWLFAQTLQNLLDVSDPANFLSHTIADPLEGLEGRNVDVLQQGAQDDYVIGGMSGAYACRAGGWPQLEPFVWDVDYTTHEDCPVQGSGFYQFNTDEHKALWSSGPIGNAYRTQAIHFLVSKHATGTGEIIDPYE